MTIPDAMETAVMLRLGRTLVFGVNFCEPQKSMYFNFGHLVRWPREE